MTPGQTKISPTSQRQNNLSVMKIIIDNKYQIQTNTCTHDETKKEVNW